MCYMVIHNLLLCLLSWAGPCPHGMNHKPKALLAQKLAYLPLQDEMPVGT